MSILHQVFKKLESKRNEKEQFKPTERFVATYDLRKSDLSLIKQSINYVTSVDKTLIYIDGEDSTELIKVLSDIINTNNKINNKNITTYVSNIKDLDTSQLLKSEVTFLTNDSIDLETRMKITNEGYSYFKYIIYIAISDKLLPDYIGYNSTFSFQISKESIKKQPQ